MARSLCAFFKICAPGRFLEVFCASMKECDLVWLFPSISHGEDGIQWYNSEFDKVSKNVTCEIWSNLTFDTGFSLPIRNTRKKSPNIYLLKNVCIKIERSLCALFKIWLFTYQKSVFISVDRSVVKMLMRMYWYISVMRILAAKGSI